MQKAEREAEEPSRASTFTGFILVVKKGTERMRQGEQNDINYHVGSTLHLPIYKLKYVKS